MNSDLRNDAWFAGFTDGEGCFYFSVSRGLRACQPRFAIGLRADDAAILDELRTVFGGSITSRAKHPHPVSQWSVANKADLAGLVEYFERFPLRAKKARAYEIWREGVSIYLAHGGLDQRLRELHKAMKASRGFEHDALDIAIPPSPQLSLAA